MEAFNLGDRVAVYNGIAGQFMSGRKGTVTAVRHSYLEVELVKVSGTTFTETVHPKQCRRLKKKVLRTIYVQCHAKKSFGEDK